MIVDDLAVRLETARYELMRAGARWEDLRPTERETRVDLAQRALARAGIIGLVQDLLMRLERSEARVAALEAELRASGLSVPASTLGDVPRQCAVAPEASEARGVLGHLRLGRAAH
jgi:hypothetical protein